MVDIRSQQEIHVETSSMITNANQLNSELARKIKTVLKTLMLLNCMNKLLLERTM